MRIIERKFLLSGLVSLFLLTFAGPAFAACTMPGGAPDAQAGDLVYNVDDAVMQYCDGTDWQSAAGGGGGMLTCTDNYLLKYNGTSSTWVCANPTTVADHLGDHIATANIQLGAYWLSSDGGNEGITVDSTGNVGVGVAPSHKLHVNGNIGISSSGYLNFGTTTGSSGYGIRDNAGVIECKNSGGSWTPCSGGGGGGGGGSPCTVTSGTTWTVSSSTCTVPTTLSIADGGTDTATDSTVPTTGSATYSCSGGVATVTGTPTCSTASCAGSSVGGYCWYAGSAGENCDTVCGSHGGCNLTGTKDYAGSAGSNANCQAVFDALGVGEGGIVTNSGNPVGCVYSSFTGRVRITSPATTCGGDPIETGQRACACNN